MSDTRIGGVSLSGSSAQKMSANPYYEKLQETLKVQREDATKQLESQSDQLAKVEKETKEQVATALDKKSDPREDNVSIGNTKWTKNEEGKYELKAALKDPLLTSVDLKNDGNAILKLFGQKIDFSPKLSQLQQTYMQNTVQAKSSNFFLSKYAQFKVGLIGQMLTAMGVTPEELQIMQKKALEGASEENLNNMGENIYNMELTELLHGKSRKSKKSLAMYAEAQQQLMQQMTLLGKPNYWSKARFLEERIKQMKKIREEFKQERDALAYQYEFLIQEVGT